MFLFSLHTVHSLRNVPSGQNNTQMHRCKMHKVYQNQKYLTDSQVTVAPIQEYIYITIENDTQKEK